jgi:predicted lactoylglutathione lyase
MGRDLQKKGCLMTTKIFVNLAVKDLDRSKAFFEQLGFTLNPQFTDETAACMVIADDIYAMLLTHPKFKEFTKKDIADAHKTTEVLTCLSFDSKDKVSEVVDKAVAAGGTEAREPQDYGFMFGRSFNDLDGHIWEIIWMDPSHIQRS